MVGGSLFAGGFPYRLGLVGDLGQTNNSAQTIGHLARMAPESVLNVGDLSYGITSLMPLAPAAYLFDACGARICLHALASVSSLSYMLPPSSMLVASRLHVAVRSALPSRLCLSVCRPFPLSMPYAPASSLNACC